MKPMSKEIAKRWFPMWSKDAHPERPWWAFDRTSLHGRSLYFRCDSAMAVVDAGIIKPLWFGSKDDVRPAWANVPPLGPVNGVLSLDVFVATVDAADPLPVPPPMPGQVWWSAEQGDMVVGPVSPQGHAALTYWAYPGPYVCIGPTDWPPPNAILVSGPTPWGRDVPWSPM